MAGITLSIEVDDKGSVKVKQFAEETKKALDEMKRGPAQAQGPLNSLKESWVGLTAKVTAATAAIYAVTKAFSSFVNEAAEAEAIENRLRFALETTGYTWQYAKQAVDEFANSIQATTRFSDEQARQALTDMMMYTQEFSKAQEGAKLAMDMSVRTGRDLTETTRLIGMAMSGNVEMLGRYIPELRNLEARLGENATMAEKAEYAMKILQQKFGGTARADLNTYAGALAQFNNAWSDLKETLGVHLLPRLKEVFEWFKKLIDVANEWAGKGKPDTVLSKLKSDLKEAERTIGLYEDFLKKAETAKPGTIYRLGPEAMQEARERLHMWRDWARYLQEQIAREEKTIKGRIAAETKKDVFAPEKKKEKTKEIGEDSLSAWNAIIKKAEEYGEVFMAQRELAERGWVKEKDIIEQVREELAKLERTANEWGEVTIARQELIEANWKKIAEEEYWAIKEGIEHAKLLHQAWLEEYTKTSEWQTVWEGAIQSIGQSMQSGFFDLFKGGIKDISDWWKGFCNNLVQTFSRAIAQMISNWVIFGNITGQPKEKGGGWGGVLGLITSVIKPFGEGGIVQGWKPVRQFQHGGVVDRPTLGMIGEGGPEAVVPLKHGKIPVEGTGKTNANLFYIYAMDAQSFREFVKQNPEAIIEVFNTDARRAGPTRGIIKNA